MFEALKTEKPELIILDIMLPGEDGIEILKKLRTNSATQNIPVIMATAKGTEMDKIHGLDLGADDYLVKPFGVMEMVSRIKAVLRRCSDTTNTKNLTAGNITMNIEEHLVMADGEKINLTLKEFEVLRLFMQTPGKVFTRENLLSSVWGVDYMGETRTVDMHIKTLRQKLGANGTLIKTVIGMGYRLEVDA